MGKCVAASNSPECRGPSHSLGASTLAVAIDPVATVVCCVRCVVRALDEAVAGRDGAVGYGSCTGGKYVQEFVFFFCDVKRKDSPGKELLNNSATTAL